jgi:glycolate oxidase FAD binding subunit
MAGSWGTLGVLSEVSLKVMPKPEATATLIVSGLSDREAVRAMSSALGSPFDVTGAAHDPQAGQTYVRIEGFNQSVSYRAEQLLSLLSQFGETKALRDPEENTALWSRIRDVKAFEGASGDVWRISVKPSDAPNMVDQLGATQVQYDWGGGLVWVLMPEGVDLRAKMTVTGHATYVRGAAQFPRFHPEAAIIASISAQVRQKFDPKGILNTGFMG